MYGPGIEHKMLLETQTWVKTTEDRRKAYEIGRVDGKAEARDMAYKSALRSLDERRESLALAVKLMSEFPPDEVTVDKLEELSLGIERLLTRPRED